MVLHHDLGLLELLLDALVRPGNSVCLYVDGGADEDFHDAVSKAADCYGRRYPSASVFVHPEPNKIYWGHISLLKADLGCLELLLGKKSRTKYDKNKETLPFFVKTW